MNLSKPVAISATMRSRRFASSPLVRGLTLAGVMLALSSIGLPQASAVTTPVHEHITYTSSQGDYLLEELVVDLDGNTLDTANSRSGLTKVTSDTNGLVVATSTATQGANLSTAEVKALAGVEIIGLGANNSFAPGDLGLWAVSTAGMADAFTISTNNAALLPGAVATLTFTVDGHFNLPSGLNYVSGRIFEPYNGASARGDLLLFESGAIENYAQSKLLNPSDFPSQAAYNDAVNAQLAMYNQKRTFTESRILHSHPETIDAINDPADRLVTHGPAQMILTAQVALNDLETTFEWLAQLSVRTDLDAASGYANIRADFASTGVLSIVVPTGFTVTSSSGQFPPGNVTFFDPGSSNPVPEPVTAVFGVMSIAGLLVATRRRRVA